MDARDVANLIWQALNSPLGIAIVSAIILWLLGRMVTARPAWAEWEGTIITAIRMAEKQIPDNVANAGLQRLDVALKYVLSVYQRAKGDQADGKTIESLRQGIQIVHDRMDAEGSLK